ncbi:MULTISPECIES: SDR family NAD(P)-dependent oxidoreductase [unclassified Haladaptatus]|uniref:SDR family NAD(P)-dependent oxidoreductase n=1 Tax=unclassified Haladaptatus TaxID=2622732 RepID=UPI0023E89E0F|nr:MULTISPECIES: glucose 1-dehydrogenase [unclassified Haladaptatus]
MRGLAGKTAFVTGSGGGIGAAIATRLAEEGATVAVNDIDADRAAETVAAIREGGDEAFAAVADVTDLEDVRAAMAATVEETGRLDVLVNNAGWDRMEWFLKQDPGVWDRIIDINLKGQLYCSRAAAEIMTDRDEGGRIVNIASDAGRVGSSGEAVYSGAKGGVIGFTKTLARELARDGITCNVVAPGPADTPLTRAMREESELAEKILGSMAKQIPLGRMTEPEDVAAAVAYFASDDAGFVTGQVLSVSGGLTMNG